MVFNDPLTTMNAYTLQAGSPATLAANVLTLPAGTTLSFGSPAWGAIQQWQIRIQYVAGPGQTFNCYLHWTNGANNLLVQVYTNQLALFQEVAGVTHQLALSNPTLTSGAWYWLRVTQFPSVAGNPPLLQATLYADAAGSVGAAVASGSVGPVATYDAVTALAGVMALDAAVGGWSVGGAYAGVHTVSLFGPGAWTFTGALGAATGPCSGAWEQNPANTYGPASGGPVTSYGAARIDLPPAGTVDTVWTTFTGGSPVGNSAVMPIAAGDVVAGSLVVRSSGLASTTIQQLRLQEWDASGVFLRQTTLQAVIGAQAGWIKLSGSVTTGASAAYAALVLEVIESVAGASANGTVWVDSAQVYDQTATGMTSMPYCECRFPQSPAQLLLTGLLGDLPSPCALSLGTYQAAFNTGQALSWALGRRGQASVNAQLVGASVGFQPSNTGGLTPSTSSILDSASYGGSYLALTLNSGGFNPRALNAAPADLLGVYHLLSRAWTAEAGANLPNVATRLVTQQRSQAWFGLASGADQLGFSAGPWSSPLSAASTWTVADSGQASIPPLPAGALTDLSKHFVTPRSQWSDATAGGGAFRSNWQLLLPVDDSLLLGTVNNPANGATLLTSWLWQYVDGLLTARGGPRMARR